ncbi:MAG: PAS domain-containing protein [Bdellovibrionota bacterium]
MNAKKKPVEIGTAALAQEIEFQAMVDLAPVNIMAATIEGEIIYVNQKSRETLEKIKHLLPISPDEIVGADIDIFHKIPAHQRRIIGDPKNLPHRAIISLGDEKMDLLVSAIFDHTGKYVGPMLTWDLVTERIKLEESNARAQQMVDKSPINIMMADPDGNIIYMNEESTKTLIELQKYLPMPAEKIVGSSIDNFHRNPAV